MNDGNTEESKKNSDHASEKLYLSNSENQTSLIQNLCSDPSENVRTPSLVQHSSAGSGE